MPVVPRGVLATVVDGAVFVLRGSDHADAFENDARVLISRP